MIRKILVLGGGSAGFLTAITLRIKFPDVQVTLLRSQQIGIIGVGEGTTFTIPIYLHGYLGIDPKRFHQEVKPTYKLGIRFLWGPRPHFHYSFTSQLNARLSNLPKPNGYYCDELFDFADQNSALMNRDLAFIKQEDGGPLIETNVAYHLENRQLVEFLEKAGRAAGVEILDDTFQQVEQDDHGVKALHLQSGQSLSADLYVDCSGFRSELLAGAMEEPFHSFASSLFCDRAVIGGWPRHEEPVKPYTTAETMNAGWAWQIEHDNIINRGYVYSSAFLSDDEAEQEFREKNPRVETTRIVKFISGRYRNTWVKNVVALGNASGFVEPLESTSLAVICDHAAALVKTINDSDREIRSSQVACYNRYSANNWDCIRRFLALHYKFNNRLDTPFWNHCRQETDLCDAQGIVDFYQANGPSLIWSQMLLETEDPFGWEGYLTMLVGQRVPYHRIHKPTPEEVQRWEHYKQVLAQRTSQSMNMQEAVQIIRSPHWNWKPDFYREASRW